MFAAQNGLIVERSGRNGVEFCDHVKSVVKQTVYNSDAEVKCSLNSRRWSGNNRKIIDFSVICPTIETNTSQPIPYALCQCYVLLPHGARQIREHLVVLNI